MPIIIGPSKRK